jgi:hypothetical protein
MKKMVVLLGAGSSTEAGLPSAKEVTAHLEALTNEELAKRARYAIGKGAFNNPKGRLRTLGLIEYPEPGKAVASSVLFFE